MAAAPAIADIRLAAATRTLFAPTTLGRAIQRLGFVQADPIRAPARAQDLILRHRVKGYRAGDLERRYVDIGVEEDFFVNYGFLPRDIQALMHPRTGAAAVSRAKRAQDVLAFVRARDVVHPRDLDRHFAHGRVTNYWGGSSSATTHLLENLHYRSVLRVAHRDGGIRVYAVQVYPPGPVDAANRRRHIDALVDVAVQLYAPLPAATLAWLVNRLRYAVPQWSREVPRALARAKARLSRARVEGVDWFWPADQPLGKQPVCDGVRLLTPFDPVVWDRRRFELLWGWEYRFEAYTPAARRKFGYYALPLLWRDRVIGWSNCTVAGGSLRCDFGFAAGRPPRDRAFAHELDAEIERLRHFLRLEVRAPGAQMT